MYMSIEGGIGVENKTQVAKALYESVKIYYSTQPGENPDNLHVRIAATTEIAAHHIKGNTIPCTLQIDIIVTVS